MPRGVRLLGAPRVWHADEWRDLPLDKRLGLLTYLACAATWVPRERLSYLFWPDVPTARARMNLRQLLARTRSLPLGDALEGDEARLRWGVESDVGELRRALASEDWRAATYAYTGDLAEGLEVSDAVEFAGWLGLERSQLRESFRRAALRHAASAVDAGRPEEAEATYARLLALDPLDEAVVRASMRLHATYGDPEEAHRLYLRFAERLADELDLEPAASTRAVLDEVTREATGPAGATRQGPWPGAAEPAPRAGPREPITSFVGREAELRVVEERLTGDECRLLTVLGPGGVGKTRLALRAAASLRPRFEDGVVTVALAGVASTDELPIAVAGAAGVSLRGGRPPLDQVVTALRDRHALLLLDEFDRLVSGALVVAELLAECPRLRCLVTSRERLRLQVEWLLPLDGLPVPASAVADADEALTYGALRLLADRARQVAPAFELRGDDLDAGVALCRLLGGLPLGVELAAGSLRTLSPRQVLEAIEGDVLSLTSDALDLPSRHRSLRAAFEHSWSLLSASERAAYRRLAAFAGEFGAAAAETVAGASPDLLAALAEKSLLRAAGAGRYVMHALLRELARGKLEEDPGGPRASETLTLGTTCGCWRAGSSVCTGGSRPSCSRSWRPTTRTSSSPGCTAWRAAGTRSVAGRPIRSCSSTASKGASTRASRCSGGRWTCWRRTRSARGGRCSPTSSFISAGSWRPSAASTRPWPRRSGRPRSRRAPTLSRRCSAGRSSARWRHAAAPTTTRCGGSDAASRSPRRSATPGASRS